MKICTKVEQHQARYAVQKVREHLRAKEARRGEKYLTFDVSGESTEGEGRERRQQEQEAYKAGEETSCKGKARWS